jgi:hypothetical protein
MHCLFFFQLSPLPTVKGLKWGNYVGSPDCPHPLPTWQQSHGTAVMSIVALPTGEFFGLGPCSCLLVMYSKEKGRHSIFPFYGCLLLVLFLSTLCSFFTQKLYFRPQQFLYLFSGPADIRFTVFRINIKIDI